MSSVKIISSTIVGPKNQHNDRLELTPCDLLQLFLFPMQGGLIFYKSPKPHFEKDFDLIHHLKDSLSQTLEIFYPLAGRLSVHNNGDETAFLSIDCSAGEGALFVHAVADNVYVGDIIKQVIVPRDLLRSLYPMNGVLSYQAVSEPFLAVQVTELADGFYVGCTMNHMAADGVSLWHFLNTWSHISRRGVHLGDSSTLPPPPRPPVFDRRSFAEIFDLPIPIPSSYEKIPRLGWMNNTSTQSRLFHFSKAKIAEFKAKANAEIEKSNNSDSTNIVISSLQALMAYLWVAVTRSRGLAGDDEVTYLIVVGLRQRMEPPLPEEYFGNAVITVTAKSTAGELLEKGGYGLAARLIHVAIASETPVKAKTMAHLEERARRGDLFFRGDQELPKNIVHTGGSTRIDWFGNDFGWGPPAAARAGVVFFDGRLKPFPGAEQGSVDFEVCLSNEAMYALAQDEELAGV